MPTTWPGAFSTTAILSWRLLSAAMTSHHVSSQSGVCIGCGLTARLEQRLPAGHEHPFDRGAIVEHVSSQGTHAAVPYTDRRRPSRRRSRL